MDVVYGIGGDLRCIYAGFLPRPAVVSVLLAIKGIVGTNDPFEGQYGFFNLLPRKYDGQ